VVDQPGEACGVDHPGLVDQEDRARLEHRAILAVVFVGRVRFPSVPMIPPPFFLLSGSGQETATPHMATRQLARCQGGPSDPACARRRI
jgi:hypothetical protein